MVYSERAGNVALEEIVMALKCLYDIHTGIETQRLLELSRIVAKAANHPVLLGKPLSVKIQLCS